MSNLVKQNSAGTLAQKLNLSDSQMDLIRRTICKDATDDEIERFFFQAAELKLNPLMPGRIYLLKFKNSKTGQFYPANIIIGIDGFRSLAGRTGLHTGTKRGVIRDKSGHCVGAWAEVFRKGWIEPARVEVAFNEYADPYKDIWKNKPETMIQKVAEVHALRMAFPDELGGVYSDDEMPTETEVKSESYDAKPVGKLPSNPARDSLVKEIMAIYKPFLTKFPHVKMPVLMKEKYGVEEAKLMSTEQMGAFVEYLHNELEGNNEKFKPIIKPVSKVVHQAKQEPDSFDNFEQGKLIAADPDLDDAREQESLKDNVIPESEYPWTKNVNKRINKESENQTI